MKLSVVILNYNVRYFLELCLKSVQLAITSLDAEIIVIDNNSSDDSCDMMKELFPEIRCIQNTENVGFSKANNQGVAQAKGEYICFLNPDTVIAEDTFSKLIEFAETKTDLGVLGCRLIDGSGRFLPESKRNIPEIKIAAQKLFGNDKGYYANHIGEFEIGAVDVFVGAFMIIKKAIYNNVNGFDEDYFMYGEDIDLSYKILKAGHKNYYYGETSIIHYKGESTNKDKSYAKRFYGAMQLFYKKHFKTNYVIDTLIYFGITLAFLFRKPYQKIETWPDYYYFISSKSSPNSDWMLIKPLELISNYKHINSKSEVIFDANEVSFKQIISDFSFLIAKNNTLNFKILPRNSNFIIGSNDSNQQGKVMLLNQN